MSDDSGEKKKGGIEALAELGRKALDRAKVGGSRTAPTDASSPGPRNIE